eukprot:142800-Pelagomonas_calceolata.AAC.2
MMLRSKRTAKAAIASRAATSSAVAGGSAAEGSASVAAAARAGASAAARAAAGAKKQKIEAAGGFVVYLFQCCVVLPSPCKVRTGPVTAAAACAVEGAGIQHLARSVAGWSFFVASRWLRSCLNKIFQGLQKSAGIDIFNQGLKREPLPLQDMQIPNMMIEEVAGVTDTEISSGGPLFFTLGSIGLQETSGWEARQWFDAAAPVPSSVIPVRTHPSGHGQAKACDLCCRHGYEPSQKAGMAGPKPLDPALALLLSGEGARSQPKR